MKTFSILPATQALIEAHARSEFPKESCGLIIRGSYEPCFNYAADPEKDFQIAPERMARAYIEEGLEAVVHSHPNGPSCPSAYDMEQQIISDVPWVIVPIHPESVDPFIIWGDSMPIAPIIGREFVHGVTDCYSCIRDAFRLGRAKLAKQGVDWPFSPHLIKDFPRDLDWWSPQGDRPALDLYAANFSDAGFRPIAREEVRPGDVFLTKIRSDKLNHGGVVVGGGLILHHLPGRLSRREPAGSWQRVAELWLRCKATEKKYVAS